MQNKNHAHWSCFFLTPLGSIITCSPPIVRIKKLWGYLSVADYAKYYPLRQHSGDFQLGRKHFYKPQLAENRMLGAGGIKQWWKTVKYSALVWCVFLWSFVEHRVWNILVKTTIVRWSHCVLITLWLHFAGLACNSFVLNSDVQPFNVLLDKPSVQPKGCPRYIIAIFLYFLLFASINVASPISRHVSSHFHRQCWKVYPVSEFMLLVYSVNSSWAMFHVYM